MPVKYSSFFPLPFSSLLSSRAPTLYHHTTQPPPCQYRPWCASSSLHSPPSPSSLPTNTSSQTLPNPLPVSTDPGVPVLHFIVPLPLFSSHQHFVTNTTQPPLCQYRPWCASSSLHSPPPPLLFPPTLRHKHHPTPSLSVPTLVCQFFTS